MVKRRIERIWSGSPIEIVRRTLVGAIRQYLLYFAAMIWLFLLALVMPHGVVPVDHLGILWSSRVYDVFFFGSWVLIALDSLLALILVPVPKSKRVILATVMNVLLPGTRLIMIPASPNHHFWLPQVGWLRYERRFISELEVVIAPFMMMITLMILPALGVQLLGLLDDNLVSVWHWILHTLTAIVWFGFVVELFTMLNVSVRPIDYMKSHWINLIIIVLPVIAFFRAFRLLKFFSLAKYSRAFSLRGVMARAKHMILVFSLVERIIPTNPNKKLEKLLHKHEDMEIALQDLEAEIAELHETNERLKHEVANEKLEAQSSGEDGNAASTDPAIKEAGV